MSDVVERLNALFAAFLQPPSGRGRRQEEWSNADLVKAAAGLASDTGKPVVTRQYISALRSGQRTDPSLRVSKAIADGFAELSTRSGTPRPTHAILRYLAGEFPGADQPAGPNQVRQLLDQLSDGSSAQKGLASVLGRASGPDGDEDLSLDAIDALLDRLERDDAASVRARLVRLLHLSPPRADESRPPGADS